MIFVKLISVFWLSICSMFSNGSYESSNYKVLETCETEPLSKGAVLGSQDSLVFRDYEFINYAVMGFFARWPSYLSNTNPFHYETDYDVFMIDSNHLTDMQLNTPLNSANILNARSKWTYIREFNEGTYNVKVWSYEMLGPSSTYAFITIYVINMGGSNTTITWSTDTLVHFWAFFSNQRAGFGMQDSETFSIVSEVYGVDNLGYEEGYTQGFTTASSDFYNQGFNDGYSQGTSGSPEITSIFTGILDVGLLPVNVFLSLFNFELFGVNVSGLITGMLTIGMIVILLRFIFGGKNNDK